MNDREILIVTGMPRTGTSMMMSMLERAGVPIVADELRPADEDNPRGYFEDTRARSLHQDASWLPQVRGRALKVVLTLVPQLPASEQFRFIVMRRDLLEVVRSQSVMLERQGRPAALPESQLVTMYSREYDRVEQWLAGSGAPFLCVAYADVISAPSVQSARVAAFIGRTVAAEQMASVVESGLYRQRGDE